MAVLVGEAISNCFQKMGWVRKEVDSRVDSRKRVSGLVNNFGVFGSMKAKHLPVSCKTVT